MGGSSQFRTVGGIGECDFTRAGSRFLGRIEPVQSIEGAEERIAARREAFSDATHVVPAYRIRSDPFREWASDDGEPRSSAGEPILNVLRGEELENVLVTVVRYYGGTNLGIGGLVRAYGGAAKRAIEDTEIVERVPRTRLSVECTYADAGTVESVLKSVEAEYDASYGESVCFDIGVETSNERAVRERMMNATSGRIDIDFS